MVNAHINIENILTPLDILTETFSSSHLSPLNPLKHLQIGIVSLIKQ